jgi:Uma2 family endonuclease
MAALGPTSEALGVDLTVEEWGRLDEEHHGELVDGRLVEGEVPDFVHEDAVLWLAALLRAWLRPRGGWVAASNAKLAIREDRGRMPDVLAYFPGRRPEPRGVLRAPPDIAVEVISPAPSDARRDRVTKLGEYAAFGVGQYWLLDPQLRTFEVLVLGPDGLFVHTRAAEGGRLDDLPGCEGLVIDLDALWAELDELEAPEE